ncbi:MAG: PAS domain S-box protein, partial [Cyanobacteria bacterium J06638_6]
MGGQDDNTSSPQLLRSFFCDRDEALDLLEATFESTADGLLVVSRDGQVLGHNQEFLRMWNLPPALIAPDADPVQYLAAQTTDPEGFKARVLELCNQTPEAAVFDQITLRDGRIFERYSQPQQLKGAIVGRIWSYRDITERSRTEAVLRQREVKYRSIFENSQVGMGRTRLTDGLILDANQRFADIMGYASPAELIDRVSTRSFYVDLGDRSRIIDQLRQREGRRDFELPLHRKDGTTIWALLSLELNSAA